MFITDMLEKDTNWSINLRRISAPEVRFDLVVSSGSANSLLAREFQNEEYFSRKDLPYDMTKVPKNQERRWHKSHIITFCFAANGYALAPSLEAIVCTISES
jgi:hypothetical protein